MMRSRNTMSVTYFAVQQSDAGAWLVIITVIQQRCTCMNIDDCAHLSDLTICSQILLGAS